MGVAHVDPSDSVDHPGRPAARREAGEAETWNALLQANQVTLDGIADAVVNSAEATTTVDPVIRLFQGVYGRVPDKAGLDYWVDVYRDLKAIDNPNTPTVNEALVALARPFVDPVSTPEFATRYGTNPDGGAYVGALFLNVLGRPADAAGLQYWEGVYNTVLQQQIAKGLTASAAALETRAVLLEQFVSSSEFVARTDAFVTQFLVGAAQQVDPANHYTGSLVNDAPTDITVAGLTSVAENSNPVSAIATFASVDKDFGQAATFSIVSDPSGYFEIVGNQLFVKAGAAVNFEAFATVPVTVKVTDAAGATYQEVVTVTITNVNEAPTQVGPGIAAVNENAAAGTVVTTLATTDPDAGDTFTYAITTNPGGKFAISGNQIVVANGAVLDFETQSSYDIIVRSTDAGGLTVFRQISVSINDVNEAPSGVSLTGNAVAENSAAGTVVGTLSAQDPDGNPLSYSIIGGTGSSLFEISGNQVVVKAGASLNFEGTNSYTLDIRASDGSLTGPTNAFTINVTNVNEAPTDLTGTLGPVTENSAAGTAVGTVSAVDPDAAQTFTYAIVGGTGQANFEVNPAGQVTVKAGAVLDFETTASQTVVIQVTDQGGLSYEKQFTINLTNVASEAGLNLNVTTPGGIVNGSPDNDLITVTDANAEGTTFNGGNGNDTLLVTVESNGNGAPNSVLPPSSGTSIETVRVRGFDPNGNIFTMSSFEGTKVVGSFQSTGDVTFLDIQPGLTDAFIQDSNSDLNIDFDVQSLTDGGPAGASQSLSLHVQEVNGADISITQNAINASQPADLEAISIFTSSTDDAPAPETVFIDSLSVGPALTTIFLGHDGDVAHLQLGDITNNNESLVATNGGALTGLQTINGSTHNGDQRIFIAGDGQDYDGTYTGGAGNDDTYIGDALNDGVLGAFDGGGGTNRLFLIDNDSLSQSLSGAIGQFTNYQSATFTGTFAEVSKLDTGLLRGINVFNLNVATVAGGTLEIERLAANSTHTFNMGTNNANDLDIDLDVGTNDVPASDQDGDGSVDAVVLNFVGTSNLTFNVTGDEVETLFVDFNDDEGASTVTLNIGAAVAPATNDLKTLNLESATNTLDVNSGANPNLTLINSVHTGASTDVIDLNGLQVSAAGATFNGGFGVDLITGGTGNDTVNSGAGNDVVSGGNGNDLVNAGSGTDTVNGDAGNDTINGEAGQDVLSGGTNNDTINGGADRDTITGDAGDDVINGGDEDPLSALNGGDSILGDNGTDGVGGNDTINGNAGNDTIDGGAGNDVINGDADNDELFGGAGNDTIDGGTGTDRMAGGDSAADPLDAAVPSSVTYTIGGFIGQGDRFSYDIDVDGDGSFDFIAGNVFANAGQTATQIATSVAGLGNSGGVVVTSSLANVTFTKADGTPFSVRLYATDGSTDDVNLSEVSTITIPAGTYDGGDTLTLTIGATPVTLVLPGTNAIKHTAADVAGFLAAEIGNDAPGNYNTSVSGAVITLTGVNPVTNYDIVGDVVNITDVAGTPGQIVFTGAAATQQFEITVGGTSYAGQLDTFDGSGTEASLAAALGLTAADIVVAGTTLTITAPDGQGNEVNALIQGFSAVAAGTFARTSVVDGVAVFDNGGAGVGPNSLGAGVVADNGPSTTDDFTQSFGPVVNGVAAQPVVTNGVEVQTNGADRFVIDSPTLTDAAADWVIDFNTVEGDTISFAGATIDGDGSNYINANGVFSSNALGFVDLNTAIAYAQALYAGNPNLEYISAWVESGGGAGYQAGIDNIYLFADINGDNLVSDIAKLTGVSVGTDINATSIDI